jgi:hypothetical protein
MASSGKKKTTMAKLQKEGRRREKRQDKEVRKVERRRNAALGITTYEDNPEDPYLGPRNTEAAEQEEPAPATD